MIGDYELLEVLGKGGMGVVYRARHRSLGREVALKLLLEREEELVARFLREGQSVAALQHPNLVRVYESGVSAGQPYLVFELVEGRDLEQRLRLEGPLPVAEALEVAIEVGEALAHAHQQGIVHRDLKPSNVLVDAGGRARLTDFGIAKQLGVKERLTQTGAILGTPAYAPPEVLDGQPEAVSPASDVYGLAATLYALIAGRAPFEGASALQLMAAALEEEAPSLRGRPGVPPALAELVARCLDKQPQRRPELGEVLTELRALAQGRARAPLPAWLLASAALLALLALLALGWAPLTRRSAPDPSPRATRDSPPASPPAPPSPPSANPTPPPFPPPRAGVRDPREGFEGYVWRVRNIGNEKLGPLRRELHAAAFDGERVLVHGGRNGDHSYADLWAWTGRWEAVFPGLAGPAPRYGHSIVWDRERAALVLVGGKLRSSATVHYQDQWQWQLGSGWRQLQPRGEWPRGRAFHGACYDAEGRRVLLWGGIQAGGGQPAGKRSDLWAWTQRGAWELLARGDEISLRQSPGLACDDGRVWLFGGHLSQAPRGDWWTLAPGATRWQSVARREGPPATSWSQLARVGPGRLLLYDQREAQLWLWAERAWWPLPRGDHRPARRAFATFTWDARREVGVLIGGREVRGRDRPVTEVWEYGRAE